MDIRGEDMRGGMMIMMVMGVMMVMMVMMVMIMMMLMIMIMIVWRHSMAMMLQFECWHRPLSEERYASCDIVY